MPVTRIKDALVSMLWTYTGAALLLVPVLTVALVLNQWLQGQTSANIIALAILLWLFFFNFAIGADVWRLKLLPAAILLALLDVAAVSLVFALGIWGRVAGAAVIASEGWLDALPMMAGLWGMAMLCRWSLRRQMMPRGYR